MKEGDRVKLKPNMYSETENNPLNTYGKIATIFTPESAKHFIKVIWENNRTNQYKAEDLIVVSETPVINNNYSIY